MATVDQIQQMIAAEATRQGVPPALALAVADEETNGTFDQSMVGKDRDTGVFQIIPSTAKMLGVDPTDLTQNISGGITFLRDNLNQFRGDWQLAVEAYNAGPGRVQQLLANGTPLPSSTVGYAGRVLRKAAAYQAALGRPTQTGGAPGAGATSSKPLPTGALIGLGLAGGIALVLILG